MPRVFCVRIPVHFRANATWFVPPFSHFAISAPYCTFARFCYLLSFCPYIFCGYSPLPSTCTRFVVPVLSLARCVRTRYKIFARSPQAYNTIQRHVSNQHIVRWRDNTTFFSTGRRLYVAARRPTDASAAFAYFQFVCASRGQARLGCGDIFSWFSSDLLLCCRTFTLRHGGCRKPVCSNHMVGCLHHTCLVCSRFGRGMEGQAASPPPPPPPPPPPLCVALHDKQNGMAGPSPRIFSGCAV